MAETFIVPSYIPIRSTELQYDQKIPKKIFQTWKTNQVSKEMYDSIQTIIDLNPEYEYHFFNDDECKKFIREYDKDVFRAYDEIIPGAYKADIWRYCVLYVHGGVYLDCKTQLKVPLREIIQPDTDCQLCLDRPINYLLNAYMMVTPRNDYIHTLIQRVTSNIMVGSYDNSDWQVQTKYGLHGAYAITGPYLCGKAFCSYAKITTIGVGVYKINGILFDIQLYYKNGTRGEIHLKNKLVMLKSYDNYYTKSGRDNYAIMFKERRIFKKDLINRV